jgi:hypothetical protein
MSTVLQSQSPATEWVYARKTGNYGFEIREHSCINVTITELRKSIETEVNVSSWIDPVAKRD